MKTISRIARIACAAAAFAAGARGISAQAELSGSVAARSSWIGLRDGIPAGAIRDWGSAIEARAALSREDSAGEGRGTRWRAEGRASLDAATGDWKLSLDQAWGEWMPLSGVSLRLGRSPLAFGPCLAFSPANPFAARDPFDALSGRKGLDMAGAGLSLGSEGPVPLDLRSELILPSASTGAAIDDAFIEDSSLAGRAIALLPPLGPFGSTELGLAGDLREIGRGDPRGELGAWCSLDLGGFVLGAEGAYRSEGYSPGGEPGDGEWDLALSASRKAGDFFLALEAERSSLREGDREAEAWLAFLRASWSADELSVSATALAELDGDGDAPVRVRSSRCALDLSYAASDSLLLRLLGLWNYEPEAWATPGGLAVESGAALGVEFFF